MRPLRIAIALGAFFLVWYGCSTTPATTPTTTIADSTTTVCFTKDILPIFQTNCAKSGCHDTRTKQDGYDLSTYSGIMRGVVANNPSRSTMYTITATSLGSRRMPPPPQTALTDAQRDIISRWINSGAQNTTCN